MQTFSIVFGLAAIAVANPLPQAIDTAAVDNAPIPSPKSAPWGAGSEILPYDSKAVADATYNSFFSGLKSSSPSSKRSLKARTQAGPCGVLPSGYGPTPDPDTAAAFSSYPAFASAANNAVTPDGYVNMFTNLNGSTSSVGYIGYDTLQSYDVQGCATKCNSVSGCIAFNIFFERDPSILPADSCPNPSSTTNIKCSYWGAPVGPETATNYGQRANDFQIVQAGSNGYNAQNVGNVPGFSGEFLDSAAINAPTECNTFITSKLFSDGKPFDPTRCAAACQAETDYNAQYLNSQAVCRFFDTYILSKNGVPQGQYCSLYTASWDDSYATNTGYMSGSDVFTISYSYSYSNTTDPKLNDCTCGVGSTCNTGQTVTSTSGSSIVTSSSTVSTVSPTTADPTATVTTPTSTSSSTPISATTTPTTTSTSTSVSTSTSTTPATTKTTAPSTTTTTSTSSTASTSSTTLITTTSATSTTSSKTIQSSTTSSTSSAISTSSTSKITGITTTSTSCTTTTAKATSTSSTSTSSTSSTTKASTTSSTTLTTSTKTISTAGATPTPKGPCFKVKIKGPSYCNNAYIGLDSTGALSYSATSATTFYLDESATIRTKDGKYGKCPNAKTSAKNGSITFGTSSDPAAVTCSGSGSSVSCKVAGQSVTSLWTSSGQGAVMLGNKPSSGKWDQVSVAAEQCSCSA